MDATIYLHSEGHAEVERMGGGAIALRLSRIAPEGICAVIFFHSPEDFSKWLATVSEQFTAIHNNAKGA